MDPALATEHPGAIDPDTGDALDCTRCGACCASGEGRILVLAEDLVLWRRLGRLDLAEHTDEGHFGERAFPVDALGACVHLGRPGAAEGDPRSLCSIYDVRGSTCREFQAGTWQCLEFRRDARARGQLPVPSLG